MTEEYNSIIKNDVWEIIPRLIGKSMIDSQSLYKIENAVDGRIEKFKVKFVA
jgi:hypothetical protein